MTGIWTLINLFFALVGLDLVKLALLGFTGGWFIALLVKDTQWRRFGFFASFVTQVVLTSLIEIYVFVRIGTDKEGQKRLCIEEAAEKQTDEHLTQADAEKIEQDCEKDFQQGFAEWVTLFFFVQTLINLYFFLVLYQHWKNSDKPQSEGGLIPLHRPDQAGAADATEMSTAQSQSVVHAADDENLQQTTE